MGGRTFAAEDIQRIQIFQSVRPSTQFGEWSGTHFRSGVADWSYGESDVTDVTDEYITTPSIAFIPQNSDAIDLLCSKFHLVVKQLRQRHSNRPTLDVNDEYDVQDLLHALLRLFFEDVRPEEWTPSYAGRSSRMDFLLPVQELVIETKKTRSGLDAKELGEQLIIDIARYRKHPQCKRLICFVYDPEGRIVNPHGIERDLSMVDANFQVKVVIAPS
jgi:hypothetical protein